MTLPKALNNFFYKLKKQLAILIIKIEKKNQAEFKIWILGDSRISDFFCSYLICREMFLCCL